MPSRRAVHLLVIFTLCLCGLVAVGCGEDEESSGGSGSANHGTLDEWRTAFPDAEVVAFGFSLGSGVKGDGVLNAITFAGDRYTFAEHVVLESKDQCKKGGWERSTKPVFRNQGDCVSSFAKK